MKFLMSAEGFEVVIPCDSLFLVELMEDVFELVGFFRSVGVPFNFV
jgi:hypothetical protein